MGNEFRFMHCADLHLGSRFKGLSRDDVELARRMRESVFTSFSNIVDAAIENDVDCLVISGDIYDDSNELPSTRMWLSQQLSRLKVPVFICRGNHDSATKWDSAIPYPENVHEFGTEPERIQVAPDVEIVGVSYSESHETRNLALMLDGDPSRFTIACVHCDLESVSEGYPYAPCRMSDLSGRGVDYWALGHIHKRAVVSTDPYVVYPGNIQGRSYKETGPKGAYLVTVSSHRVAGMKFIPTGPYVWSDITVDIAGRDLGSVIEEVRRSVPRRGICRITFAGSGQLDTMLRTEPDDVSSAIAAATGCTISSVSIHTSPEVDPESYAGGKSMQSAVIATAKRYESMSKEEIVALICRNRMAARHRDFYMSLAEEDLRSIVADSMKDIIVRMEVPR